MNLFYDVKRKKWLKIMRISCTQFLLAILFAGVTYARNTNAQVNLGQKIDLNAHNVHIEKILKRIEKITNTKFVYSLNVVDVSKKATVAADNETLGHVLDEVLLKNGIGYDVIHNRIVLTPLDENKAEAQQPSAGQSLIAEAEVIVHGKVTDDKGTPLVGVTVQVKNTNIGTVTNSEGEYTIYPMTGNDTLVFSYIGYNTIAVPINGRSDMSVKMEASSSKLNELVVVGYGTQKKEDLSGSISVVSTKQLTNRPVTSLTNALQGTVPGMVILSRPGDVGSDIGTVNILGRGNLGASAPLFVVDGVPVSAGDFARIDPNDVASISVLKDAAAAAIYGARAAYGVVLVTTKKGEAGKMIVNYNGYYGSQSPTVLPHWLGSYDYAMLRNEAATNAGGSPVFSTADLQKIKDHSSPDNFPDNNWYDLVLRKTAPIMDHEINVSGGNKTRYYLGGDYFLQNSILPGKDLRRYSLRANTESEVSDHFKVGTNISYIRDGYNNNGGSTNWVSLNREVPLMVNKQSNGQWGSVNGGKIDGTLAADNPVRMLEDGGRSSYATNRFIGSVNATLTPVRGLDINGLVSYNLYSSISSTFTNAQDPINNFFTGLPISGTGVTPNQLQESWENVGRLLTQATASYEKTIGKNYGKLMVGSSYENYKDRTIGVTRKDFVNNTLDAINGGSTDPINTNANGDIQENALESYFGRFNYSFSDRYLFQANLRADGSSQFAPGHRWGIYPSFSAAWRISQESFMRPVNWVSDLKIRGSWGKLGNINNVGNYDFYDAVNTGTTAILDQTQQDGAYPGKLANPTLSWEKVTMSDIGVDGGFWNNELIFQLDLFNRMTHGILQTDPSLPDEMGLTGSEAPVENIAQVLNKGIEFDLTYQNNIGGLHYAIGGNFTRIWNRVVKLAGNPIQPTGGLWVNEVGKPIGSFYMLKADGLFKDSADIKGHAFQSVNTGPGDIKYEDINGDGKINGQDRTIVGEDVPYIYYGVNLSASYKNFDLAVLGQGVTGVSVYLAEEASQAFFNGAGAKEYVLGRWTKSDPNPNAPYPRVLTSANNTQNLQTSSFWLFNASYFRVKSLSVGYSLPNSILSPVHIQRLRVYVSSNNIFTIRGDKRMKDFDPESASTRASYPQMKSVVFGVNLTF